MDHEPHVNLGNGETQNMLIEAVNTVYANRRAAEQAAPTSAPPNVDGNPAFDGEAAAAEPVGLLTRHRAAAAAKLADSASSPTATPTTNFWGQTGNIRAVYRRTTHRARESQPRHGEEESETADSEVVSETEDDTQIPLVDVNHASRTGDTLLAEIEDHLRNLLTSRAKDQMECQRLHENVVQYKRAREYENKKVREACAAIEKVEASLEGMEATLSVAKATIGQVVGSFVTRI